MDARPRRSRPAGRRRLVSRPASASHDEVLPWDHLDSGLDKDWLWEDWQDSLAEDRARGLPLDAVLRLRRAAPQMGTEIQIGPTGATLLPLTVARARASRTSRSADRWLRLGYAGSDGRDRDGAAARRAAASAGGAAAADAVRQARPAAVHRRIATSSGRSSGRCAGPPSRWPTRPASPRTRRSRTPDAAPTGAASEAEYLEIGLADARATPSGVRDGAGRGAAGRARRAGRRRGGRAPARWPTGSRPRRWRIELPGVGAAEPRAALDAFLAAERVEVERLTEGRPPTARTPRRVGGRRERVGGRPATEDGCAILDWSYGRSRRRYDPTTCSPRCVPSPASCQPSRPRRPGWRRVGLTAVAGSPTRSRRIARRTSRPPRPRVGRARRSRRCRPSVHPFGLTKDRPAAGQRRLGGALAVRG